MAWYHQPLSFIGDTRLQTSVRTPSGRTGPNARSLATLGARRQTSHCTPKALDIADDTCSGNIVTTGEVANHDGADSGPIQLDAQQKAASMQRVGQQLIDLITGSSGFSEEVAKLAVAARIVDDKLRARVSASSTISFDEVRDPVEVEDEALANESALIELSKYLLCASSVIAVGPMQLDNTTSPTTPAYEQSLIDFGRLHTVAKSGGLVGFRCESPIADGSCMAMLKEKMSSFIGGLGDMSFVMHSNAFCKKSIYHIMASLPEANFATIHMKVLGSKADTELCPLLMPGANFENLACMDLALDGSDRDLDALKHEPTQAELLTLQSFIDVAQVPSLALPGVHIGGGDVALSHNVPSDLAMTIMWSIIHTKDIASLAAKLHTGLIKPISASAPPAADDCLGLYVFILRLYKHKLTIFDSLLSGASAMRVEEQGLQLPVSFGALRGWREGMSFFAGRSQNALMEMWSALLVSSTSMCKAATPTLASRLQRHRIIHAVGAEDLGWQIAPAGRGAQQDPLALGGQLGRWVPVMGNASRA